MNIYERISSFWDANPCGTTHLDIPSGTLEYFEAFDQYYIDLYPYLLPFLDLESMRGKTVMEIGLGSGVTLHKIAQVAQKCYGLDISPKTIELNESRNSLYDLDISLINTSATQIPLPDNSLDVVVSIGCLHHIPDIQKAVSEIHRVLKPGGVFKGMVYYKRSWRFMVYIPRVRRFSAEWKDKSWQECVNEMYDGQGNPYGMIYSKSDVRKLFHQFKNIKFEVQNFSGHEFSSKLGNILPRNFWLGTLGRVFGLDLYFTAKTKK